ncbi:hypothetical protein VD0002_g8550 [Verticillium dahliae]|uniref:Uncharacterized protein n=2 Tax=Verticillium dahliae TaxID=27337 RepID=G2X8H7_VERDV|nr:uncharacterized protein VDAG_06118 [Verticillium dahliae VdLs.17]KAF3342312.1 Lactose permease [Verticillium dahliae VDG2]KAH6697909.1 hypothetical protein EV126DRAFT_426328 [Verticillium dahliae]EGY15264.1 hypothetical protein VDAG_06118 [Verticillium dahliae VdLs.17]PNH28080.1 hypothetical protein BJF96_g8605 [Verticillium dahliae]PNH37602.1 hypothetical protein VD0004_g9195 [Verticillium dahliae]
MSLFAAQLHPGRALGFLILGASLHDVLTRLKAEPQRFPQLDLAYSRERPIEDPVSLTLPANGLRLRFDGPEQRLRLIEIIDFTKNHITFKDRDLVKPANAQGPPSSPMPGESSAGPTFRHIYHRLLGPTYGGEYIPPTADSPDDVGNYVLSYPGVAFTFRLAQSAYSPNKDVVSLLSSSAAQIATSMAVFAGDSWSQARENIWSEILPSIKTVPVLPRGKDVVPDEISLVKIHGGGKIQLFRKWTGASFWVRLGETTPQELVAELGPPNATYRKNDQRMTIHKIRTASHSRTRANGTDTTRPDELTDTDQSSAHTGSDDSNDEVVEDDAVGRVGGECFYNYFYLGFDVLVSTPTPPSQPPPTTATTTLPPSSTAISESPDRLVATKLVLHGNVPGSYEFNRHRRCRWEISYLEDDAAGTTTANSEARFTDIEERLHEAWKGLLPSGDGAQRQRGMVLNRGWGDSPGSSVEFLGGWEDSGGHGGVQKLDGGDDSTTTLYGFPGLVFEVLKNGLVNTLTVF